MLIEVFKSKIHRVRVTASDLNYIGSITIDEDLIEAARAGWTRLPCQSRHRTDHHWSAEFAK